MMRSSKRKNRILVVEDDVLVGESIKCFLENFGYDAASVSIGLAALDLVSREHFDLIIADIRMPGMNGIETLKAIRDLQHQFNKPPIPEIILTGYADEAVEKESKRMGISDFIMKPFRTDAFLDAIRRNLKKRKKKQRIGKSSVT